MEKWLRVKENDEVVEWSGEWWSECGEVEFGGMLQFEGGEGMKG